VYNNFIKAIEYLYKKDFSKEACTKYLCLIEIEKILNKKVSYYEGLSNIENIIRTYNLSINESIIDTYGEKLNKELSEVMHSFDLESSIYFSEYNDENLAIEKINSEYKNSIIDDVLNKIYKNSE